MEFRQLEYFEVVSRLKNYTKAAQELLVAQPSISISIQKLEEEFGIKLLERDNKRVALTSEGEIFLLEVQKILRQAEHLKKVMNDVTPRGKKVIKLAFPSTVGAWLWPILLGDFQETYANIELIIQDLSTYDILKGIKSGELEIGFGVLDISHDAEIETHPLRKGELKLLVSSKNELIPLTSMRIEALEGMRVIMYRKGVSYSERIFLDELKIRQIDVDLQYVREQSTVFNMVAQNLGVAVVLEDKTDLISNNSNLRSITFAEPISYDTGLFWKRNGYLSGAAKQLINYLDKVNESNYII